MFVKKKIYLLLIIITSLSILYVSFLDKLPIGSLWYNISPNTLVGTQNFFEVFLNFGYLDSIFIYILKFNIYLILAFTPMIISFFIFIFFD